MHRKNKFVFFDVGGVLLRDFSGNNGWKDLKNALGITEQNEASFDAFWDEITPRICTSIDIDDLLPELTRDFAISPDKDFSLLKAFVDRFERLEFMQNVCDTVGSQYDIGLLTNMYPRMLDEIIKQGKLPTYEWHAIVDSSHVGYAKPEEGIFNHAKKECGRQPQDIFFIDNTQGHLQVAESLGWQTFWFDPKSPEDSAKRLLTELDIR